MSRDVLFYCGINEKKWNYHPVSPGSHACVTPTYGSTKKTKRVNSVALPKKTAVIQDSGAFSDGPEDRLEPDEALDRQERHATQFFYTDQITHVASYDLLIDEMWHDGQRQKGRWSEAEAWRAVEITIEAAEFLHKSQGEWLRGKGLVLSSQGVTPGQYVECTKQIIPMLSDGDILGLGGWCISGKMPTRMMPVFSETMTKVIPLSASSGVKRVHIWGVIDSEFLGPLLYLCDLHGIVLSTDSCGPSVRPARNGLWGYKGWANKNYERPPTSQRGAHRAIHVCQVRQWLRHGLRKSPFYHYPTDKRIKWRES